MLKLGESSLSTDRGCCTILSQACLYTVDPLEKHKVAPYRSASREHMLIVNFRKVVERRLVKVVIYFIMRFSFYLLVWRNGSALDL